MSNTAVKESYFVKDKGFYKILFKIMVVTTLQNLINYGVNMADNIMLGSYGQTELSAASVVNQVFFLMNAFVWNTGNTFSILAAQYWGKGNTGAINRLVSLMFKLNMFIGIAFFVICTVIPAQIVGIFTSDAAIIEQGVLYLGIIKYTFIPYAISNLVMDMMKNVETVSISFYMSIVSLIINVCFNYMFIFGNFGCTEMGIQGAAYATLIARVVEVCVLVIYVWKFDKKLQFFKSKFWERDPNLVKNYFKLAISVIPAGILWSLSLPIQTALLGSLSADAIAANSVSSTYYQLLKVVAQAMSAGAAVVIGKTIGQGDFAKARAGARTLELIGLCEGIILGGLLFILRPVIMSMYSLTPEAQVLTDQLLIVMSFVMMAMSYEHTLLFGTLRAGGDAKFSSIVNVASMWCFAMPLAFMGVFWWHVSPIWVVIFIQSEQLAKCFPVIIRIRQYDKWMRMVAK